MQNPLFTKDSFGMKQCIIFKVCRGGGEFPTQYLKQVLNLNCLQLNFNFKIDIRATSVTFLIHGTSLDEMKHIELLDFPNFLS